MVKCLNQNRPSLSASAGSATGKVLLKSNVKNNQSSCQCHFIYISEEVDPDEITSIVDNYLKMAKRKLRQVESFRDKDWAGLFFLAQTNTRNFTPH